MTRYETNVRLAPLTTFGVGGAARLYKKVTTPEQLVAAVGKASKARLRYVILAGGSNVVFSNREYDGVVIHYQSSAKPIVKNREIIADAGVLLAKLIKTAINNGLAGIETLSGIPGTVGGAIVGNAGAYGQCISDHLESVQIFDGKEVRWVNRAACKFAYRESIFKHSGWLVLRVKFKLEKGDKKVLAKRSREIIKIREAKYKPGLPCPGSFFKNVLVKDVSKSSLAKIDQKKIIDGKIPTGYLLEQVGARGLKFGRLEVADFHGNLLINRGGATYAEVRKLASLLKSRVRRRFGIELEEEVRYIV